MPNKLIVENYTIERNELGMFLIKFIPDNTYCGKSFDLTSSPGNIEDWWETQEGAEKALLDHLTESGTSGSDEPLPLKEYDIHFSVSGNATVLATSKTEALENLAQETFGSRINRDTATVIGVRDLPEDADQ